MWQQIEGFVTLYVVLGVVGYTVASAGTIERMKPMKGTLADALLFVAIGPLLAFGVAAKALVEQVIDATKSWRRLFQRDCGTEEMLLGAFWLWGTAVLAHDGNYGFALLTGLTWLYLWQSARAMQKLRGMPEEKHILARGAQEAFMRLAEEMAKRGEGSYVTEDGIRKLAHDYLQSAHPEPSRETLDKYEALRGQVVPALSEEAREQRQDYHQGMLREIRAQGRAISASLEAL